jgi:hypothetical protein
VCGCGVCGGGGGCFWLPRKGDAIAEIVYGIVIIDADLVIALCFCAQYTRQFKLSGICRSTEAQSGGKLLGVNGWVSRLSLECGGKVVEWKRGCGGDGRRADTSEKGARVEARGKCRRVFKHKHTYMPADICLCPILQKGVVGAETNRGAVQEQCRL